MELFTSVPPPPNPRDGVVGARCRYPVRMISNSDVCPPPHSGILQLVCLYNYPFGSSALFFSMTLKSQILLKITIHWQRMLKFRKKELMGLDKIFLKCTFIENPIWSTYFEEGLKITNIWNITSWGIKRKGGRATSDAINSLLSSNLQFYLREVKVTEKINDKRWLMGQNLW